MPALKKIRMTLTGPYEGKTKLLNRHQFINGVAFFTGNDTQVEGVTKYFTRSYQVDVTDATAEVEVDEVDEVEVEEAIRVDDSDVLTDEQIEEEEEEGTDPPQPNARQAEIIAAVNCTEKDQWVDLQAKTPHPKVKDIQTLMGDPTINKNEIIEVIEIWLS